MILWFIPKPSSCEFPVGHHILTTTINLAAFPSTETEPFLPLCLDCQSCNPATLRFCPVALTNIIQLVLSPCRKSSKIPLSWTITFVTLIFPFSLLIFSPLWSEPEATPPPPCEPFPTSKSSLHSSCSLWPDTKPIPILNLHTSYRMCQIQITSCALNTSELTCLLFS